MGVPTFSAKQIAMGRSTERFDGGASLVSSERRH